MKVGDLVELKRATDTFGRHFETGTRFTVSGLGKTHSGNEIANLELDGKLVLSGIYVEHLKPCKKKNSRST